MSDINKHFFQSVVTHYSVPPHIFTVWLNNNGNRILKTQDEYDEFQHLFTWVDKNEIYQKILALQAITLPNHRSIVAIYGDVKKVINYPNKDSDFWPPHL